MKENWKIYYGGFRQDARRSSATGVFWSALEHMHPQNEYGRKMAFAAVYATGSIKRLRLARSNRAGFFARS